jgi:hypothetical protein
VLWSHAREFGLVSLRPDWSRLFSGSRTVCSPGWARSRRWSRRLIWRLGRKVLPEPLASLALWAIMKGTATPVWMISCPPMEAPQNNRRGDHPSPTGPINILPVVDAHVFVAIPDVIIRRVWGCHVCGCGCRRRDNGGRWSHKRRGRWVTAGHNEQECRQTNPPHARHLPNRASVSNAQSVHDEI